MRAGAEALRWRHLTRRGKPREPSLRVKGQSVEGGILERDPRALPAREGSEPRTIESVAQPLPGREGPAGASQQG
jgi:hypothetical protein